MSARSRRDRDRLEDRLVQVNPLAALRILDEIDRHCQFLADNPHVGWPRPKLPGRNTRVWPVEERYLIVHRPILGGVRIVRIVDDWEDPRKLR